MSKKTVYRGGKQVVLCEFCDDQGMVLTASFFSAFATKSLTLETWYLIIAKIKNFRWQLSCIHPELIVSTDDASTYAWWLYPIYSEMAGIKPARFVKQMAKLRPLIPEIFQEYLPEDIITKNNLPSVPDTIAMMHFPTTMKDVERGQRRIFFDRILRMQLAGLISRQQYSQTYHGIGMSIRWDVIKEFVDTLPFELTNAQKKVITQIIEDLHGPTPMMRLVQGDVGSGKTIVAIIVAWYVIHYLRKQVAFLVPLAVLSAQHAQTIAKFLLPRGVRVEVLQGSLTARVKQHIKDQICAWYVDLVVGTHAIVQDDVVFKNLGLVIIDEQHKFGVKQRGFLKSQGSPHILQMSATPIPRSLALAYFGECDISVIDELPAGRKPIITKVITDKTRHQLRPWMTDRMRRGEKVFVIAPLVDESEHMDNVANVIETYEQMQEDFPEFRHRIGLMHGKLKPKEKDEVMRQFAHGDMMMLVSTTVIEVGVDVRHATMMIIMNAERFGLSQLHQLRGRIGRNDMQSYCFLDCKKKSSDARVRLSAMEDYTDWFTLARIDMQQRGPWEVLGTRQSGEADLPFEILADTQFVAGIHDTAVELIQRYPWLEELPALKRFVYEEAKNIMA